MSSNVMRNMSRNNAGYNESQKYKWIVLDGDIDPEWIESLNTVMDDNKMLTLVSNERIPLDKAMRLLFEIADLDNATPATVSRAGILYINTNDIGSKPFWESWVEARPKDKEKSLLAVHNKYCTPEILHEINEEFVRVVPINEVNIIKSLCYLLEGLLEQGEEIKRKISEDIPFDAQFEKDLFEVIFIFACIWAYGGSLPRVDKGIEIRKDFSGWWKRVFPNIKFPDKDATIFDYCINFDTAQFELWNEHLPKFIPPHDAALVTQCFVPTVDSIRQHYLFDLLVPNRHPVLIAGNSGTGKSILGSSYLKNNHSVLNHIIHLNYYTDASTLQTIMESVLDKRSGKIYGPRGRKSLVYFIDDLNMPKLDTYNTQSPTCLVRQQMDYGCWYDLEKLEQKEIRDVQYMAAMNPTSGSFVINPRYQNHFVTFACALPTKEVLSYIYGSLLSHHFSNFSKSYMN